MKVDKEINLIWSLVAIVCIIFNFVNYSELIMIPPFNLLNFVLFIILGLNFGLYIGKVRDEL